MIKIIGSEFKWVYILVLPLTRFMTLGKFLNFSVVRFSHLYNEGYNSVYFTGLGKVREAKQAVWYMLSA